MTRCPVCAEALVGEVWRCEHCDAQQHPECARYFGGCAIFACRDARAPTTLEIASWPESVRLVRQLATVSRWKARAALAYVGIGVVVTLATFLPWLTGGRFAGIPFIYGLFVGQVLMCLMPVVFMIDEPIRKRLEGRTGAAADAELATSIARIKSTLPAQSVPAALDAFTRPRVVIWLSVALFALMVLLYGTRHPLAATAVVFVALFGPIAMAGLSRAIADIGDTETLLRALEAERARALPAKPKASADAE